MSNVFKFVSTCTMMVGHKKSTQQRWKKVVDNCWLSRDKVTKTEDFNVLVLPGGVHWEEGQYGQVYIDTIESTLKGANIFVLRCNDPVIDPEALPSLISRSVKMIRKESKKPVVIIGISVGGYILAKYLAEGYDDADNYFICMATICFDSFYEGIDKDTIMSIYKERTFKVFKKEGSWEEFLTKAKECRGKCVRDRFISQKKIHSKTRFIIGGKDTITEGVTDLVKGTKCQVSIIKDATHWCYNMLLGIPRIIERKMYR